MPAWLAALFDAIKVFAIAAGWLKEERNRQIGADLEAGKVNEASAKTEAAIADAVVNAPRDQAGVVDRLRRRAF
jgi:hypothetical protein